jgi:hypothetical protein
MMNLILLLSISTLINSQKIENAEKKLVIDSITVILNRGYIFEEVGKKMTSLINNNYNSGVYASIEDGMVFCDKLTEDLISISKDKHLRIRYAPEQIKEFKSTEKADPNAIEMQKRRNQMENYGFKELKIMPGNIGYLKFDGFDGSQEGFQIANAAMNYLSNSDAIIFDLRENGGGSPEMIQLISSYLFEGETQHLNSFYYREMDQNTQTWTLPYVQGKRNPKCLVYILTSNYTFSAAEEFTYNLKNMNRATIVGETTGGGAHPVTFKIINDNFFMSLPFGRAINPITKTNWEGTGIEPHIKTTKEKALDAAYLDALNKLSEKEQIPELKAFYTWAIEGLNAKSKPVFINESILKSYVGKFGPRIITFENGNLYYQREGRPKFKMYPIQDNYFGLDGMDSFRIKFIKEGKNILVLEGHYSDGMIDKNEKTK